jgi:hypothetical protein
VLKTHYLNAASEINKVVWGFDGLAFGNGIMILLCLREKNCYREGFD